MTRLPHQTRRQFLAGLSTATVGLAGCTEGMLSTRREWRFDIEEYPFTSPTFDGNTVYAGCDNGILYALRADDGTVKWQYEFHESLPIPSVSLANGTVYFGDLAGIVYAVDADTGDVRWRNTVDSKVISPLPVVDGVVYANAHAFDATTGDFLAELPPDGSVSISIVDRTAYLGYREYVGAFNLETGVKLWEFDTEAWIKTQGAVVADGSVYVANSDGTMYALDAATGKPRWQVSAAGDIWSPPTVADETVYFGASARQVYALDVKDGSRKWQFETEMSVNGAPVVADGTVYFGDADGYLFAVNSDTGDQRWRFNLEADTYQKVALGPEHVYISSYGSVQAIRR